MRQFRRIFFALFILATLLGALHEVIHHHVHDMEGKHEHSCPLYLLSQNVAVPTEQVTLETVHAVFEPYRLAPAPLGQTLSVLWRSRSPPPA